MMHKWIYHQPRFECDQYNPDILIYSPWAGHRNFAYDYVSQIRPERIVELGSYYGCSSFAILQAIKDFQLDSEFFAVDTWQGDSFTQLDYQEDIYGAYKQINDQCFGALRSHMIRKRFDEALSEFEDRSIDLLHIDGSHRYEDVKNDYELWRCKVRDDGVIFFHDVGHDLLFGEPMGSHFFWEELKKSHPFTLELPFSNGLGMLFYNEETYRRILQNVDFGVYQMQLNLQDTITKDAVRKKAFIIRDLNAHNADLKSQIAILNHHLDRYKADTEAANAYRKTLEQRCADSEAELWRLKEVNQSQAADIQELKDFANQKERYIQELEQQVAQLNAFAGSKEAYIAELLQQVNQLKVFADSKENYIAELLHQIEQLKVFADSKENCIAELLRQIEQLKVFADSKENYIAELLHQIEQLNEFAGSKEHYISELQTQISMLNDENSRTILRMEKDRSDAEMRESMYLAQSSELSSENKRLTAEVEALSARLKKLPFGKQLLERALAGITK